MMRAAFLALFAFVAVLATACGDAERPRAAASSPGTPDPGEGDGGSTAPPTTDASLSNPELCEDLSLGGEVIAEVERVGGAPEPVGGEPIEGVYDLVEATVYIDRNPDCGPEPSSADGDGEPEEHCPSLRHTDRVVQSTLVVTEYAIRRIAATGIDVVGEPVASADVYEIDGTDLVTTSLCPEAGTKRTIAYSASGAALTLLDGRREELYVLR